MPVAAVAAILAANAAAAPRLSAVSWYGNTAFGLAAAAPVSAGIATIEGRVHAGVAAASVLALSIAVLLLGNALSALYLLVPLLVFGVPGLWFGRRLAVRTAP